MKDKKMKLNVEVEGMKINEVKWMKEGKKI
jgi:uncharacterized protein YkuJ